MHSLRLGRSSIHAWGVFANAPVRAGDLLTEYTGELVRPAVADLRERQYARRGMDTSYFFRMDDDLIIDATMKGNLARFVNHSCQPNCESRTVLAGARKKVILVAKVDLAAGEELVYDYNFMSNSSDKIPCHCGAPNCWGRMN